MFSQNIGAMYDSWLLQQADEYMSSGCDGEPQIVNAEKVYEGTDADGNIEYSIDYTYSCEDCEETDCEHWKDFHQKEWEELQAE
jgi:hypothetical protein